MNRNFGFEPEPFNVEENINLALGKMYFWWFLENVFSRSFDGETYTGRDNSKVPFEFSALHREWALLAQYNPRLCIQAPRSHLKTTVIGQGGPFWQMFKAADNELVDGVYFSYKAELADEKVADLKRRIKANPYCRFWKDRKPTAESIIDFFVDWGDGPVAEVTLIGSGIKSATRGRHPKYVICLTPNTLVQVGGRIGRDPQFKRIDEIRVGDEVITHRARKRQVTEVMRRSVAETLVVMDLANGNVVRATANHRFLTKRGWVRADGLTVRDVLLEANPRVGDGDKIVGENNGRWIGGQVRIDCQREGCSKFRYVTLAKRDTAKYCSVICRGQAVGENQLGELNSNWRNGHSTVKRGYSLEFTHELREQIRELYGRKCALCGFEETDKRLDVHHIDKDRGNASVENLIALCHPCHMKTNIKTDYDEELAQLVGVHNGTDILVVGREWYEGEVWNLEVEGDHTYALQGCVVHNCDDILSDFTNPLDSSELRLINRIFRQTIMSLPSNFDDPLWLVGTPQAYDDILYQLAANEDWLWLVYPAVKDWVAKTVQWPEKYDFDRLMRIRKDILETPFEVEYQLTPVTVTDQFLTREDVLLAVDDTLKPWSLADRFVNEGRLATYGGLDVGKLVHPSHISIFLEMPSGTLIQLFQRFLDGTNYPQQVKILNALAEKFKLTRGYFDNTRNELDDRNLDRRWRGRTFTKKLKADVAVELEKRVFAEDDEKGIILLGDDRQIRSIVQVRKDLSSDEGPDGHGDAFWSNALAVKAAEDGPTLVDIGGANPKARVAKPGTPRDTMWKQLGAVKEAIK